MFYRKTQTKRDVQPALRKVNMYYTIKCLLCQHLLCKENMLGKDFNTYADKHQTSGNFRLVSEQVSETAAQKYSCKGNNKGYCSYNARGKKQRSVDGCEGHADGKGIDARRNGKDKER